MITINKEIENNNEINIHIPFDISKTLIFDIETTGFSPIQNSVYLIGCIYFKDDKAYFIQWLCEKEEDEYELLFTFSQFLLDYSVIIHYNGTTFDLPFLEKRFNLYHIQNNLIQFHSYDLYQALKPYGKYLPIENLKLTTLEKYFNIYRKDIYSGKDLIQKYQEFLDNPSSELREMLLLHNEEDVLSLYFCLMINELIHFFHQCKIETLLIHSIHVTRNGNYLTIDLNIDIDFNLRIQKEIFDLYINSNRVSLSIPLFTDELKYFHKDFENYYYLTKEDMAVHKSIGKFVDPHFRKKAKKSNCYTKKRSTFIPLFINVDLDIPFFYRQYNDSIKYIEVTKDILENNLIITQICTQLLRNL